MQAGCALVGGETAEHPGLLGPDEYDVAGSTTGVVEADRPARPRPGPGRRRGRSRWRSSGLHSNGYSLVRHVLLRRGRAGWALDRHVDELGRTLGEELLEPTRIYAKACLDLARQHRAPTRCRTSPAAGWPPTSSGCCRTSWSPRIDRATWTPQPVFDLVRRVGAVAQRRPRAHPELRRRHGRAHRPRGRRRGRSRCSPATACAPGSCGEVAGRGASGRPGGSVTPGRPPPRLVSRAGSAAGTLVTRSGSCGNSHRRRYGCATRNQRRDRTRVCTCPRLASERRTAVQT